MVHAGLSGPSGRRTWFITFISHSRGQMASTSQVIYAGLAMNMLQSRQNEAVQQSTHAAVEQAEKLERERGA